MNKNILTTKILAEIAVFVSLATVLSYIKIFSLPQGGSVTAASMVPIFWLALRRTEVLLQRGLIVDLNECET